MYILKKIIKNIFVYVFKWECLSIYLFIEITIQMNRQGICLNSIWNRLFYFLSLTLIYTECRNEWSFSLIKLSIIWRSKRADYDSLTYREMSLSEKNANKMYSKVRKLFLRGWVKEFEKICVICGVKKRDLIWEKYRERLKISTIFLRLN